MEHRNIPRGEFHGVANWSVASTAERDVLVVSDADIGKQCWVRGTGHFVLAAASPMTWEAATIATPTVAGVFADATAFGVWAAAHADDADALHTLVHITALKATYFITAVTPAITGVLIGETQFPYVTYADAAEFAAATPTIDVQGKIARVADTDSFYFCKLYGAVPQWVNISKVQSVFGRTGVVTAQNGDYTAAQVGADAVGSAAAAQAAAVQRTNHTGTQLAATISDFNATASAAAPVQSVNGHTGIVTVAEGVSRTTLQSSVLWFEDFLTHQSSLWARVTASSGVATTLANDVSMTGMANACGVLRVVWNTTGGYCTVSTSTTLDNKRTSVTGKTASSLTAMAIDAYPASVIYDFQVFGGWGGFDNNGIAAGTTEAALWYFDKDGLYLYTCTGGVSTTSTIALASSGITADTYFRIRIEYTSTAVNLYVDNVLKLTNTTNIPQTYMSTLSWMVRTASAIVDYANANLSLDYIDQQFTLTTPRVLT